MLAHAHARPQLPLQQIALIQKQYDLRLGQQAERAQRAPEEVRVLEAVHAPVLREALVEARDGREEDDRVHVVEVGVPVRALGGSKAVRDTRA